MLRAKTAAMPVFSIDREINSTNAAMLGAKQEQLRMAARRLVLCSNRPSQLEPISESSEQPNRESNSTLNR